MAEEHHKALLAEHKVVPDVVDDFASRAKVVITYGSTPLLAGTALRVVGTQEMPQVSWEGEREREGLYTLVMVDPDAPSPESPTFREFLHWIVTDIPGTFSATCQNFLKESHEVVPYMGPAPPEGRHRYIFVLYKQTGKLDIEAPTERKGFNLRKFAQEHKLGTPLYTDFFYAEKDEGPRN